jgi:Ran GTPase-activating protein (RanGAP) involved in mRNA processing and transport
MSEKKEKSPKEEAEEVKEILSAVSTQVPALIKSLLASVFSEEAGRSMGKAAAAYYKELKESGMPEDVAVKMTEDYMKTFTSLGSMLRNIGSGRRHGEQTGEDFGEEIGRRVRENVERRVREKVEQKTHERESEEEEEKD